MWRIIFIAALNYIVAISSRPMEPIERPFWSQRIAEAISSPEHHSNNIQSDFFKQRYLEDNMYNPDADYNEILPRPADGKRALAIMSRWKPISNFGKDYTQNGAIQTRARDTPMVLRWG